MNVEEFIKWLQTQDQDAIVEVLVGSIGRSYQGDSYNFTAFDPSDHADYIDMRGNPHAKGKPCENKRFLQLGETA